MLTMWSLRRSCSRLPCTNVRQFCTSPVCGVRAIFAMTENEDLNKVLNTIQEKIVLPAYLPEMQREMVFDKEKKTHLEQNPIVLEVEGLEHQFSYLNRFKDIPNSKDIFNKALHSMRTPEDWANLGTLLLGYKKAGIKLQPDSWSKIVRMAGESGNIFTAIECAKQANQTGLRLDNREGVALIFLHINNKIVNSNVDKDETKQALRLAEVVLDLLQRPEHLIEGQPTRDRLHFSGVVRGMTLFTRASAFKAKQQAEEPVEQDLVLLKDEVDLLSSLWKGLETQDLREVDDFAKLNPVVEKASARRVKVPRALNGKSYVQVLALNIKGISLARELLGEGAESLAKAEDALNKHLKEFAQVPTKRGSRDLWEQEYQKIVGHAPQW